ncbi:bromodomain adjacent to zinc finger domain protein 2A isoform X2 [Thalassophryne amazonica]|uniref:bromodomain adjacent to zinc finger domain protein 2A isoform X2 n=1 Tax=Thalassophryne amazonica TaxID=390379 RepID=UPI001470B5C7|nr:bromodomain adjacent to zinc finger domain protein 2A isoform X2 [Thalassophryne amazonica]
MEANNHFNYGTHSSANSGLKRSSGDSLYTNGSSGSFSQQGKNMNGEMNVNGITTVLGSSVPGSQPPTATFPHASNRHQSGMGYQYLWGGHSQYGPSVGASPGQVMHQKQSVPGTVQPQSQHHYQSHGQYQLNGCIESTHQASVTAPPNISIPGSQYWNRTNPGQQQLGYNSHSMYGTYQTQRHQQQSFQSQQQLLSHHHTHHCHQQPQHYGVMPNGMPYYQHQPQHQSLPSTQPDSPQQSQPQGQTPVMSTAVQSFTPLHGSPQHHSLSGTGTGSPVPMGLSSVSVMSSSAVQDSGPPQSHNKERSLHASNTSVSTGMQAFKDVETAYNGIERAHITQRILKSDSSQQKTSTPHMGSASDYLQNSDQTTSQHPEMISPVREPVVNTPPDFMHSTSVSASSTAVSPSLVTVPTPQLCATPAVCASSTSTPGLHIVLPSEIKSAQSQISTALNMSSCQSPAARPRPSPPPMLAQDIKPSAAALTEISVAEYKHLSAGSLSSPKLSDPLPLIDSVPAPATLSSVPSVSAPLSESVVHQTKSALASIVCGPMAADSPLDIVPTSYSASVPTFQQVSQGSKLPTPVSQYENSAVQTLSGSGPSTSVPPGTCLMSSAPLSSVSNNYSVGSVEEKSAPSPQHQTLLAVLCSSLSTTATTVGLNLHSAVINENPTAQPLPTLPLPTTQASRTAPVSAPPALVPVISTVTTPLRVMQNSDSEQLPASTTLSHALKQSCSEPECHGHGGDHKGLLNTAIRKPEECLPQLHLGNKRILQSAEAPGTCASKIHSHQLFSSLLATLPIPEKSVQTTVTPELKASSKHPDLEKHHLQSTPKDSRLSEDSTEDQTKVRMSLQLCSSREEYQTGEDNFDESSQSASEDEVNSTYNSLSGANVSSVLEETSVLDGDSSCADNSTHFDSSIYPEDDTSHAEDKPPVVCDTTRESDSIDDTTKGTQQNTGDVTLESSLNDASQMDKLHAESHASSCSFVAAGHQGPKEGCDPRGQDTPDSVTIKTTVNETSTPSSFGVRDGNFAFSTPAENLADHPFQQVADHVSAPAGHLRLSWKQRKPPSSKPVWIKTPALEQRKPRVRIPKDKKMKSDVEGVNVNKGDEGKMMRRKRKKFFTVDVKETSDLQGVAGAPSREVDSITATIDAVLASTSTIHTVAEKSRKLKMVKKEDQEGYMVITPKQDAETTPNDNEDIDDDSSNTGETNRRRVATEEQVQFPLQHGWKREIRVKKIENRLKGETWYYAPCGRRMKQFPEIIKYLNKHQGGVVSREHFSFSPRMPVGDFYEERETPEGKKWILLKNEEIPSMIMAITGRRGRPPNPDKEKSRRARALNGGPPRRPGRPPKLKMVDLLSKVDAKLFKRLEAKEALNEEDKEKLVKIKKKMKKKARVKRREDAKIKKMKEEKKRAKLEQHAHHVEVKTEPKDKTAPQVPGPAIDSTVEPKKPGRRRSVKVEATLILKQRDEERLAQGKRVPGARCKAKAVAKAEAEAEAAVHAAMAAKRAAERRAQAQKRLEERKRQQIITEELKKPTEDMCLTDHKPLPDLSRVPGVVLSGTAFAHCLAVVEFLHGYGKLLGLNVPKDIPSLDTLQKGLLGLGDNQGEVQDLLLKMVKAALYDPGLPSYYQSVKILGEKLVELQLTRNTVSEVLRIFLESHGYETEVCNTLRTKTFHALPPDTKAAILGFLVEELNGSNIVTCDIDNTLENMTAYRKNKWIIEGKLRKLKAVLARRTGRSEEELCFEERRRSARVAEEENMNLEDSGLVLERGSRRARKEEPKLSDNENPTYASIAELERQLDKLTRRQVFFRKKLQQSSHSMRAMLLGQDRFRRRYLALPHLGGVLVEGPEELLTSGDVLVAEVPVTFLKKEPKVEEASVATTPPPTLPSPSSPTLPAQSQFSPEDDPLPGTASLMSRPRGRGRPRKIKPEVELHLRTAKIRRQRRSSVRSRSGEGPRSPVSCTQDLTQAAFRNWLIQSQEALTKSTSPAIGEPPEGNQFEESVKEMAEKHGQWFNLLPKEPCDDNSLTEPQIHTSPPKLFPQIPSTLPILVAPLVQIDPQQSVSNPQQSALNPQQPIIPLPGSAPVDPVTAAPSQETSLEPPESAVPLCAPPLSQLLLPLPAALPLVAPTPTTPARPGRRRRRGSRGSSPGRRGPRGSAAKRRGRPPNSVFQELEQQYFTQLVVKPIPASMVRGWWWIKDPEELCSTLQALHPRGIRERVLHKHLAKHMESHAELCTKPVNDPIFELKVEQKDALMEALQQPWQVQDKAMEADISALQWVEDLEQRVVAADLHLKAPSHSTTNDTETKAEIPLVEFQGYTIPEPDSTRDDLQYYEHDTDPRDDWIVRTKKEWSGLPRIATHPVDLSVLRLANLERNIERRYLKEPLWNPAEVLRLAPLTPTPGEEEPMDVISLESEITSRLRTWRQALDRCRSAPQICLCLLQLEKAIAWERSVTKVTCQVCWKGDNDECLLLCDGCDRGCHMYCLKPKITQVPEGDWFCPICVAKEQGEVPCSQRSSKKRTRVKRKRYEDESSDEDATIRRSAGMTTRHKDTVTSPSSSLYSGDRGSTKRRRMTTRNQPDLTFCEIILMEMESHADAWPFLEPVNPRLVPGYRRIIKNPMDFLTMRERLLQGGYCSCDEFAADAQLVFNNCELFNEDTSEVGMAGHSMRRFFESRWAEFYSKDK